MSAFSSQQASLSDLAMLTCGATGAGAVAILMRYRATAVAAASGVAPDHLLEATALLSALDRDPGALVAIEDPCLRERGHRYAMVAPDDDSTVGQLLALFPSEPTADVRMIMDAAGRQLQLALRDPKIEAESARGAERPLFYLPNVLPAVANFQGYFVDIGPQWTELLGWSAQELKAVPFMDFVHPDDVARTAAEAARLASASTETLTFENRYRRRDGSYCWLSWRAISAPHDGSIYAVAIDVTDANEVREKAHRQQALLNGTARLARIGGWEVDLETMTPLWSEEVYRIHEVPVTEQLDLARAFGFFPPEVRHPLQEAFTAAVEEGKPYDLEMPFITATGRRLWVRTMATPEFEGERCVRLSGLFQDITERKQAELAKREFVSTVSHELRTPLTSIRGALRLVAGGLVGDIPTDAQELVQIASQNAERLIRLINDLLDLDRIAAGRMQLRTEERAIVPTVRQVIDESRGLAAAAGVTIAADLDTDALMEVDRDRIAQVVTNLLSNAIKFSPEGGVVTVRTLPGQCALRVEVSDQGPGIAEGSQAQVFERFRQLDSSSSRSTSGSGLGLAICKAIIEEHGGEIGVSSEPGRGSTFWFELNARPVDYDNGGCGRLLLVDDDDDFVRVLRIHLAREGWSVARAATADQARQRLRTGDFDAMVIDVDGPATPALALVREVQEQLAVVALSVYDRGDLPEAGGLDIPWLNKPLDERVLLFVLRRALRRPGAPRTLLVGPGVADVQGPLAGSGVDVRVAPTAAEGDESWVPDLLILDEGRLNELDALRAIYPHIPLVMVGARPEDPAQLARICRVVPRGNHRELLATAREMLGPLPPRAG